VDAELVIDAREVALDRFLAEVERGRMIVTPGPALAKIPCVIAVAYGVSKSAAVRNARRG
jgi:DNA-binding transcriptional regulator LsrR (DeoR family)